MFGLIQDRPLLLSGALAYAANHHGNTPIMSRRRDGTFGVTSWWKLDRRVRALASAMVRQGVRPGDRVATLAWNNQDHLEVYFAATAIGAICHPINPRLFLAQILYIAQHAEDRVLFFDHEYASIARSVAEASSSLELVVHFGSAKDAVEPLPSGAVPYEEILSSSDDDFAYPELDERQAASLCYTSGTTGNPKGVLSSHRALILHAMTIRTADLFALSPASIACAIVPLYHAHGSWGLPFAAAMSGASLVLPGLQLGGSGLVDTIRACDVTVANGVPTIWQGVTVALEMEGGGVPSLKRVVIAGAAPAVDLVERLENDQGVEVCHIWGMTETGPCATSGALHADQLARSTAERHKLKGKQGHGLFGVEMRVVDEAGIPLPRGEEHIGELQVRGPYVSAGYFKAEGAGLVEGNGWFTSGDIASIDDNGYLRLVDRAKDLVKSGGEWISSIDVENAAIGFPGVLDAAVIAVPHEKWGERPLLLLVAKPGAVLAEKEILSFLGERLAKWWLPDRALVVAELPRTGTGKVMKGELRKQYGSEVFLTEGAETAGVGLKAAL